MFDDIEYDIKFNLLVFNAEECLIIFRYYNNYKDMHKHFNKHANINRIYSELGRQGYVFNSRKEYR